VESFLNLSQWTSSFGLILYALASILYLASYSKKSQKSMIANLAFSSFIFATILETTSLFSKQGGVDLLQESGTLLAEIIGWFTILAHFRFNLKTIGAFIAPLITLILLVQFYTVSTMQLTEIAAYPKAFLTTHIVMGILGQAAAISACGFGGVYLRQQRLLKQKMLENLNTKTPALDRLELYLVISLWAGFIFITAGLLSGAFYSHYWGTSSGFGIKVVWAILVWAWYLIIISSRSIFSHPVHRTAKMSFIGFLLLSTTFFGIFGLPTGGL
jgi:ABC-type uncharacterized transport system permease subunit